MVIQSEQVQEIASKTEEDRLTLALSGLADAGFDPGLASGGPLDAIKEFLSLYVQPAMILETERVKEIWHRAKTSLQTLPEYSTSERLLLAATAADFLQQILKGITLSNFDPSEISTASLISLAMIMLDTLKNGPWMK